MSARVENALLCTLFAVAFLATAGWLRPLDGGDHETELLDKLDHLEAHATRYNALVVGASGIFRGIDPLVFDERVQRVAPEFRSFNLGARFMLAYESDAQLREAVTAIEAGGGRLRWVLLEPKDWDPRLSHDDVLRVRTRAWHDLRLTAAALHISALELFNNKNLKALDWATHHVQSFSQRVGNYGAARRMLRPWLGELRRPYVDAADLESARGYVSIEDSGPEQAALRNLRFSADLEGYRDSLAELASAPPEAMHTAEHAAVRRQREWLEARGIRVLHLMAPYGTHGRSGEALLDSAAAVELIDFARPESFPELYEPEVRLDREHLTEEAAAVISALAGDAIADRLAAPRPAGNPSK